ncbi:MAG: pyrroline-5-carboxylate reductase dimerization domain-containing protein [Collinsella sp.]
MLLPKGRSVGCLDLDSAKWEQVLPGVAHISTVPNTPVSVGEGVIACEKASTLSDDQRATVLGLLGKLGTVVELDSSLLFVGGTVGGCAPAFVAMAIEALGDAAVKHGIPRADAYRIVSQMVLGTAKLQLATGQHPAAMKDAVCSPGGATIKGVVALEDAGMRSARSRQSTQLSSKTDQKRRVYFGRYFLRFCPLAKSAPQLAQFQLRGASFAQIKQTKINLSLFGRLVPEAVFLILGLGSAVDVHLMGTLLHYKGKNRK